MMLELDWKFLSIEHLKGVVDDQLSQGWALLPGSYTTELNSFCSLIIHHPSLEKKLSVEVRVLGKSENPEGLKLALESSVDFTEFLSGEDTTTDTAATSQTDKNVPLSPMARIRKLNPIEQRKMAKTGMQQNRVVLERAYGKAVWDVLLTNPRITIAEVAKIARNGTASRPLLDKIVDNPAWAKTGTVRRALLSNPRLGLSSAQKVLKLAPRNELVLATKQTTYPPKIRDLARKMIKQNG